MAAFLGATGVVAAAPTPARSIAAVATPRAYVTTRASLDTNEAAERGKPWGAKLGAVDVWNRNTNEREPIRLYGEDGALDPEAAKAFMRVARSRDDAKPGVLSTRLVKLVLRAAYHFGGATVAIVSGTRRGASGRHGTGEALDFSLEGVSAGALAAWLRKTPRAGVGIYVHPKTQYVHLDVRDHSYHWVDASPPGVTWREKLLPDPTQADRDASYSAATDLPETAASD
ncbi:MAG TPA: hypothetical protein VIF62_16085 [Labilithrix sp.]